MQQPELQFAVDDVVTVDYQQFVITTLGRLWPQFEEPVEVVWAGKDGATFASGASDHEAALRLEVWSAEPPPNDTQAWEAHEDACLVTTADELAYGGPTSDPTRGTFKLPPGNYGIRGYVAGRQAARAAQEAIEKLDPSESHDPSAYGIPPGTEKWLVQLWPLTAA